MRTVFIILSAVLFSSTVAVGLDQEEEVSWEEEEQAAIRGPRLPADPVQPPAPAGALAATGAGDPMQAALPAPQLFPLPDIETSAWALLFPGACLALVAVNVGWRRKRRSPRPGRGGSDD